MERNSLNSMELKLQQGILVNTFLVSEPEAMQNYKTILQRRMESLPDAYYVTALRPAETIILCKSPRAFANRDGFCIGLAIRGRLDI